MSNKFSNIKERVLYVSEIKGVKREKFFRLIGMTYGNFTGKAKETPLNSNAIENILLNFPDINSEWLITGKGEMLKNETKNNKNQSNDADLKDRYKELQKFLDEHNANFDINELLSNETEISILKEIVEDYKKQIIEKDRQLSERDKQINKLLDLITK